MQSLEIQGRSAKMPSSRDSLNTLSPMENIEVMRNLELTVKDTVHVIDGLKAFLQFLEARG